MAKKPFIISEHITPLNINGLNGRMLRVPPKNSKKREMLLVYGHHASIERMSGLIEDLNKYGGVTVPDLPGFGGMESFYKIGKTPTLDNLADYLAAFIKLRYKRRRITILGVSFGFLIVTRMLQKHPDLAKKVDLLVSIVGFVHNEDFHFNPQTRFMLTMMTGIFSRRLPAWFLRNFLLQPFIIRTIYRLVADRHIKFRDSERARQLELINFEVRLWRMNDIRTHMDTLKTMFRVNLCNKRLDLPVCHVGVAGDRYFDNHSVEQHMRVIFSDTEIIMSPMAAHAPTVVATASEAAPFVPRRVRRILSQP